MREIGINAGVWERAQVYLITYRKAGGPCIYLLTRSQSGLCSPVSPQLFDSGGWWNLHRSVFMAFHERMRSQSFFPHDQDEVDDADDGFVFGYGYGYGLHHPHNLSRLSMCTLNSISLDEEEEDDGNGVIGRSMISIESFDADADADEELSDDDKEGKGELGGLSSDSDKEPGCYSLPATPLRRRNRGGLLKVVGVKEYASENEAHRSDLKPRVRKRRAKVVKERAWDDRKKKEEEIYGSVAGGGGGGGFNSFSGESEGTGLVVITRPKGGRRSLCMDLEEVKACRDLGFELEHERMLEMPTRISISGSTLDTSSGGNSPIASWRISSPGDDPRDVKARLKVWAQAVALASTSRQSS